MREYRLDALICRLPENVLLLTGYWPLSSTIFALYMEAGPRAVLIVPHTEEELIPEGTAAETYTFEAGIIGAPDPSAAIEGHLREAARTAGVETGRIGVESGFEAVAAGHAGGEVLVPAALTHALIARALPEASIVDATPALNGARAVKTPAEIEKLRRSNVVASFGLQEFRDSYEPGRTEADVASRVEAAIMHRGIGYEGAQHVRAWAQLMTGLGSAMAYSMHPATSNRVIQDGDLGVLELGTHVDGYWSDLTRTLVAGGKPNSRQIELYLAVVAATNAVIERGEAGMMGGGVDALARKEIERRGLGEFFVHQTGHGLGFRYHEPQPQLHPDNRDLVEAGMVSSVEPGLYVGGFGGMRLEENVVFRETGVELLSHFDRSLA
jgi:Xaa-Pro aminopeptidase